MIRFIRQLRFGHAASLGNLAGERPKVPVAGLYRIGVAADCAIRRP